MKSITQWCKISHAFLGPVSRKPRKLFGPVKPQQNLEPYNIITELFYSQIVIINSHGSLHTRSFRHIHFSIFRCRWTKNGFYGPEKFPGLSRNRLLVPSALVLTSFKFSGSKILENMSVSFKCMSFYVLEKERKHHSTFDQTNFPKLMPCLTILLIYYYYYYYYYYCYYYYYYYYFRVWAAIYIPLTVYN